MENKYAVSLVIFKDAAKDSASPSMESEVVVVQRPSTDKDLPNVWGLPAGMVTFTGAEGPTPNDYERAAVVAGMAKMGVDVEVVRDMGYMSHNRGSYTLHMTQFQVRIVGRDGAADPAALPVVPQPVEGITQYQSWRWGLPHDLLAAADKGSVCSRIFLTHCSGGR